MQVLLDQTKKQAKKVENKNFDIENKSQLLKEENKKREFELKKLKDEAVKMR